MLDEIDEAIVSDEDEVELDEVDMIRIMWHDELDEVDYADIEVDDEVGQAIREVVLATDEVNEVGVLVVLIDDVLKNEPTEDDEDDEVVLTPVELNDEID